MHQNKYPISGVLIIHNDCSLLDSALASASPYIDELIVIDGAYKWVSPFCHELGEDPEKSTDDLFLKLNACGIPYKYFSGVWENETHKRTFSLEQATNDHIMLIDSDELFELDSSVILEFLESGKAIGECRFPLYFDKDIVGYSKGLQTPPNKEIFLNKGKYPINLLVDSLFLIVPEDERQERIQPKDRFKKPIGTAHHLSLFRSDNSGYRRSRFYNLLSMRVAKKLTQIDNSPFDGDVQFFEKINNLTPIELSALNTAFHFHRITAAFPVIKENQYLHSLKPISPKLISTIENAYSGMIREQEQLFFDRSNRLHTTFSNRSIFIDVTCIQNKNICIETDSEVLAIEHQESKSEREFHNLTPIKSGTKWTLSLSAIVSCRKILEIKLKSKEKFSTFSYQLQNSN